MNLFEWRYGDTTAILRDVTLLVTAITALVAAFKASRSNAHGKSNGKVLADTSQKLDTVLSRTNGLISSVHDAAYSAGYAAGRATLTNRADDTKPGTAATTADAGIPQIGG